MATEHTTVFIPLIDEGRMDQYGEAEIQLDARASDSGVDITFTPKSPDDQQIYMVAPGEVFFVAANTTVQLRTGPKLRHQ